MTVPTTHPPAHTLRTGWRCRIHRDRMGSAEISRSHLDLRMGPQIQTDGLLYPISSTAAAKGKPGCGRPRSSTRHAPLNRVLKLGVGFVAQHQLGDLAVVERIQGGASGS